MHRSPNTLSPYLLILFFALWVAWMGFIFFLNSILSGWHALSKRFRTQSKFLGKSKTAGPFFNVCLRNWTDYSSIIKISADEKALYLSPRLSCRIGHPPLCIPWKEIKIGKTKFLWQRYVVLTLGEQERIPMRISERTAGKLGILDRLPA